MGVVNCSGSLSSCLDTLSSESGVSFNYKTSLVSKADFVLPKAKYTLGQILSLVKTQCEIDNEVIGSSSVSLFPQVGTFVYGTLLNLASNEKIANGAIKVVGDDNIYMSDKNGLFRFYTLQDSLRIVIYHQDYQLTRSSFYLGAMQHLLVKMQPVSKLNEVEISKKNDEYLSLKSFDEVNPLETTLPTIGGETDALNNVKLLPGIQNLTFGEQGLIVRGGGPDQNFTLLDGIPVYNTFHMLGLYSIFNPSSINSIKVYKDAFPSKYTSRLSSVIDVSLNNGNKNKTDISADIGILSSGVSINGPLIKEKLSYNFSFRRTYADAITLPIQKIIDRNNNQKSTTSLWSYDLFGKMHYQINSKNQLSTTVYNGGDQLSFDNLLKLTGDNALEERTEGKLGWRNTLYGLQWHNTINSRAFMSVELSSSEYSLKFNDSYSLERNDIATSNASAYKNGVKELRGSFDLDIAWTKKNMLNIGVGYVRYIFSPFERRYNNISELNTVNITLTSNKIESEELYIYAENKSYFEGGNITLGLRVAKFRTAQKSYLRFQPKILLIQNLNKKNQLRFGLSSANQFIHLVPNNSLGLPVDIWLPVTNTLKPLNSTQLSSKYVIKVSNTEFEAGIFSKYFNNILEHQNGAQFLSTSNWEQNLYSGSGISYGFETSSKITLSNYSLYGAYIYSRSKNTIPDINDGIEYFSNYDRPHNLSLLAEYDVTNNDKILLAFNYASGNPITIPSARYISVINGEDIIVEEFDKINNFRLPATHHLDFSYIRNRSHQKFKSSLVVGVYNVYNRLNPFMVYIGLDDNGEATLKLRSYLPTMPMLKYTVTL